MEKTRNVLTGPENEATATTLRDIDALFEKGDFAAVVRDGLPLLNADPLNTRLAGPVLVSLARLADGNRARKIILYYWRRNLFKDLGLHLGERYGALLEESCISSHPYIRDIVEVSALDIGFSIKTICDIYFRSRRYDRAVALGLLYSETDDSMHVTAHANANETLIGRRLADLASRGQSVKRFPFVSAATTRFSRVYHAHIQKTGGTSINHSLYEILGANPKDIDENAAQGKCRSTVDGYKILAHDGLAHKVVDDFTYCHSHGLFEYTKYWRDRESCLIFTILRDPVARFVSYYNELLNMDYHPKLLEQVDLAKSMSIVPFAQQSHEYYLKNQIVLFSGNGEPAIARSNLHTLDAIFFQDDLEAAYRFFETHTGRRLTRKSERAYHKRVTVSDDERAQLAEILEPEIRFVAEARRIAPEIMARYEGLAV